MFGTYILLTLHVFSVQSYSDYYWRDYNGTIPPDAIPADVNNTNCNCMTYIGQVYAHNNGLRVGSIVPGAKDIVVSCWGYGTYDLMIKILCAKDPTKYVWIPTIAATFNTDLSCESPMVSGYDRACCGSGILNIGRTSRHGRAIVGNVAAYNNAIKPFYYPLNGADIREPDNTQFEVLVYRDKPAKTDSSGNCTNESSETSKFLGLYIDPTLSWTTHIQNLRKKISPIIGV